MAPRIPGVDGQWHVNNILREVDVVHKIYEHIKTRMRSNQIEWDDFMLEDNIQKNTENLSDPQNANSSIDSLMIQKAIEEVNDDLQIGHKTSESHLEMLKTYN